MEEPTVLFTEEDIHERVRALGAHIARDYAGKSPILISVLKGSAWFLADLIKEIDLPLRVDFMSISSYGGGSELTGGVVRIIKDLEQDIGGQDVVLVEDIVDTGLTLSYLRGALQTREPASLAVCTLLDKSVRRIAPLEIAYAGFDCPDSFVIGYGLDFEGYYRNLPYILEVDPRAFSGDPLRLAGRLEGAA